MKDAESYESRNEDVESFEIKKEDVEPYETKKEDIESYEHANMYWYTEVQTCKKTRG